MRKIKWLIVLFLAVPVWKIYEKINFPIVLSRLSVLKLMTEVSVSCILCCKFKNITSTYDVNKVVRCLFLVSVCKFAAKIALMLSVELNLALKKATFIKQIAIGQLRLLVLFCPFNDEFDFMDFRDIFYYTYLLKNIYTVEQCFLNLLAKVQF